MLYPLLMLIAIVIAVGIVFWALQGVTIPAPFNWIVRLLIAIVALVILFQYVVPMFAGIGLHHSMPD